MRLRMIRPGHYVSEDEKWRVDAMDVDPYARASWWRVEGRTPLGAPYVTTFQTFREARHFVVNLVGDLLKDAASTCPVTSAARVLTSTNPALRRAVL